VLVALGLTPILAFAQGNVVSVHRKAAGVPYPNSYATPQQAKEKPAAYKFNCAQRAHANLLENMPQTMMYMLFAGLEYPTATAGLGLGWLLSRALYAYGYIQGQRENGGSRLYGSAPGWLIQGGLWALCISTALKML
jgi:glutathione S-transferase